MIKKKNIFFTKYLLKYLVKNLNGIYLDCTYGMGIQSKKIIENISKKGSLIAFEIDSENFKLLNKINFFLFNSCFTELNNIKLESKISGILIDIGYTVNQLKDKFNFRKNNFLDNNIKGNKSVINLLNFKNYKKIKKVIGYFEKEFISKKIAKEIIILRKLLFITNFSQIKGIIYKIKKKIFYKKNKTNIYRNVINSFRNYSDNNKKKILNILNLSSSIILKNCNIMIYYFNSFESKIIKSFFKKRFDFFLLKKIKSNNFFLKVYQKK
ncbi:16S rRNA (cytosine(1402)-N(4))-methyltransferase [Candidatus Vidania fulgoroideorum]